MNVPSYLKRDLAALLGALQGTDVEELEVEQGGFSVRLRRTFHDLPIPEDDAPLTPEPVPLETAPATQQVVAPVVGTFYRAAEPGLPPLVEEGAAVDDDTVLGIVEALQVVTTVVAGVQGTIARVLTADGHAVEYGQPLFEIRVGG